MFTERQLRLQIVEIGEYLYNRNYIVATDGNISVRLGNHVLITPSGVSKGKLNADDMLVTTLEGQIKRGRGVSSSEIKMHLEAYRMRENINAVVHAHPPYATAFAVCGLSLETSVLPELILSLNKVPLAAYATPGTAEVGLSISELIKDHDGILLENHGVVTVAEDLHKAFMSMERIEHAAQIVFLAKQIGNPRELTEQQITELRKSNY